MEKVNSVYCKDTVITGGLWKEKQDMVRKSTIYAVYDRFKETGRIDSFKCTWKEGDPVKPHYFWDSDVAKWMEAVAYLTQQKREPKLEKIVDGLVDDLAEHQWEDGYINSYFTVIDSDKRFTNRDWHELYCAGHLMEAAVAYYEATGKRKFLEIMCRYADFIEKYFKLEHRASFTTPGHEEIELALFRLYHCTGEKRYLELAEFFLNERGKKEESSGEWSVDAQRQSHLPVREQTEAVGHAVRAVYLYCGMADMAYETEDESLLKACRTLFDDIVDKKMYITGGIGSSSSGEAFTVDYDLPNLLAYTESCAALGLALFANRMLKFGADSRYSDTVERIIYNGFLSSVSLDGKSFFYENPLEVIPYLATRDRTAFYNKIHMPPMSRSAVFGCSCCPPNISRFIPSIGNMLYTADDTTLYVHQYMQSKSKVTVGGKEITVEQKTKYPSNGKVKILVKGADIRIGVRVPWWSETKKYTTENGYAYFDVADGKEIVLNFGMPVRFIEARTESYFDIGKAAVMRGPVVYCMESADNGPFLRDIRLDSKGRFSSGTHKKLGVPMLKIKAYRSAKPAAESLYHVRSGKFKKTKAILIPYYAFANREVCEMQVWSFLK